MKYLAYTNIGPSMRFEEEKFDLQKYGDIDLSNKRDSFVEYEKYRNLDNNFSKNQYQNNEYEQNHADSKNLRSASKSYRNVANYVDNDYLVKKHLNSSNEIDYEEIVEPHEMYIKDRDTQTPVRETSSKGIQCGEEAEPLISSSKNPLSKQTHDLKKSLDINDEVEKLPFSTIKK